MSEPAVDRAVDQVSTGELVGRLSEQSSALIRDEIKLAQLEITQSAKQAGVGVGMFGAAGVVALYGVGVLLATAVVALDLLLPLWLAALIVTVVLFAVAGVLALLGRKKVSQAAPLTPQETVASVKADVAAVKEARS